MDNNKNKDKKMKRNVIAVAVATFGLFWGLTDANAKSNSQVAAEDYRCLHLNAQAERVCDAFGDDSEACELFDYYSISFGCEIKPIPEDEKDYPHRYLGPPEEATLDNDDEFSSDAKDDGVNRESKIRCLGCDPSVRPGPSRI